MPLQQRRWGGVTAGTAEVVITTKLFRPGLRQQTVERKRLYDLLREGRTLPLTLVVAPAGWGKSTIVADWLARDDVTAGWVSLDGGDNDPKRFWRYLLLAAGQAGSAAGAAALRRLDAAGFDVLRDVLPAFVNELASAEAPLVLVLDDYHLVTSAQVHATVATLLDRCPPQLHLMLITRADPPLPLSRLRVRGDLAELRADDLRFSAAEAVEFFSSRLGTAVVRARRAQAAGADRGMGRRTATGRFAVARPAGPFGFHRAAHRRGLAHRQLPRRGGARHSARRGP